MTGSQSGPGGSGGTVAPTFAPTLAMPPVRRSALVARDMLMSKRATRSPGMDTMRIFSRVMRSPRRTMGWTMQCISAPRTPCPSISRLILRCISVTWATATWISRRVGSAARTAGSVFTRGKRRTLMAGCGSTRKGLWIYVLFW